MSPVLTADSSATSACKKQQVLYLRTLYLPIQTAASIYFEKREKEESRTSKPNEGLQQVRNKTMGNGPIAGLYLGKENVKKDRKKLIQNKARYTAM